MRTFGIVLSRHGPHYLYAVEGSVLQGFKYLPLYISAENGNILLSGVYIYKENGGEVAYSVP
jgi:hypothetical protein